MATVKVFTSRGKAGEISTSATKSEELKLELNNAGISTDGLQMVVGETKVDISNNQAIIPTEDFKLYLIPIKTKSGVDLSVHYQRLADAYQALADACSEGKELSEEEIAAAEIEAMEQ